MRPSGWGGIRSRPPCSLRTSHKLPPNFPFPDRARSRRLPGNFFAPGIQVALLRGRCGRRSRLPDGRHGDAIRGVRSHADAVQRSGSPVAAYPAGVGCEHRSVHGRTPIADGERGAALCDSLTPTLPGPYPSLLRPEPCAPAFVFPRGAEMGKLRLKDSS